MSGPAKLALFGLLILPILVALKDCGTRPARAVLSATADPAGALLEGREIPTESELRSRHPGRILPARSLSECLRAIEAEKRRKRPRRGSKPVPEPGDCFHSPDPESDRE